VAEVSAIYDTRPIGRIRAEILAPTDTERRDATDGPTARNKCADTLCHSSMTR
jgi:hypothetical protein